MPTKLLKDLIGDAVRALYADHQDVTVTVWRNNQDPEPPRDRHEIARAHVYVVFLPSSEQPEALGIQGQEFRREFATIMVHFFKRSGSGDVELDNLIRVLKNAARRQAFGSLDVHDIFEGEEGSRFGGAWRGVTVAVTIAHDFCTDDDQ